VFAGGGGGGGGGVELGGGEGGGGWGLGRGRGGVGGVGCIVGAPKLEEGGVTRDEKGNGLWEGWLK